MAPSPSASSAPLTLSFNCQVEQIINQVSGSTRIVCSAPGVSCVMDLTNPTQIAHFKLGSSCVMTMG